MGEDYTAAGIVMGLLLLHLRRISARMETMVEEKIDVLLAKFLDRGGKIDKYYLSPHRVSRQVLVNLNGWFSGKTVREAITKAFAGQIRVGTGSAGNN